MKKNYTIDATDRILGRLAVEIAILLRGKHKPNFSPHSDRGDEVTIINTSKLKITGKKEEQKKYRHHSSYPGGLKEISYKEAFKKDSSKVLRKAVYGMLPKNKLRAKIIRRLRLYAGEIK